MNLPSSLVNLRVWRAKSRVGERMRALTAPWGRLCLRRWSMGMRKAAVLPEPVRAMATTSEPERMRGMVLRWMGVGMV